MPVPGRAVWWKSSGNSLDLNTIQWREGHSYGYSQNIPYFPLIDLLSRAWQIKEGDPPDQIRQKVENGSTSDPWEKEKT